MSVEKCRISLQNVILFGGFKGDTAVMSALRIFHENQPLANGCAELQTNDILLAYFVLTSWDNNHKA